eukprot:Clim_evm1s251 gene=Clim_evmTU1s251
MSSSKTSGRSRWNCFGHRFRSDDNVKKILHARFLFAVLILLALITAGLVIDIVTQVGLEDDGNIINTAGRQRMYSQRLSKLALEMQMATTREDREANLPEMSLSISNFRSAQDFLTERDGNPDEVDRLFEILNPIYLDLSNSVLDVFELVVSDANNTGPVVDVSSAMAAALAVEQDYLNQMDTIVNVYNEDYNNTAREAVIIASTLFACAVLVILSLYVFLLIPTVNAVTKTLTQLTDAKQEIGSMAKDLEKQNFELQEAVANARELAKVKSEFLAVMSHELRTPLNGVLGMTQLLVGSTELSTEQRNYVDTITSSSESLLSLLNDVLDFTQIDTGKLGLTIQTFDLQECTQDVLRSVFPKAWAKDVEVLVDVDPAVPTSIRTDRDRLTEVLRNLLSNAIKFTSTGEIGLDITVDDAAERCGSHLLLHVRDTGVGIPVEKLQSIFEPFTQLDASLQRQFGGTGLGLAVTRRLVELMGGQISVVSEPGLGTVFTVQIPMSEITVRDTNSSMASSSSSALATLSESDPGRVRSNGSPAWGIFIRNNTLEGRVSASFDGMVHGSVTAIKPKDLLAMAKSNPDMLHMIATLDCAVDTGAHVQDTLAVLQLLQDAKKAQVTRRTEEMEIEKVQPGEIVQAKIHSKMIVVVYAAPNSLYSISNKAKVYDHLVVICLEKPIPAHKIAETLVKAKSNRSLVLNSRYQNFLKRGRTSGENGLEACPSVRRPLSDMKQIMEALDSGEDGLCKDQLGVVSSCSSFSCRGDEGHALALKNMAECMPLNILIADDHVVNQKYEMRLLSKMGYKPDLASDGQKAVEKAFQVEYDLILMDVAMPVMDGLAASKHIRENMKGHYPMIVAVTANAMMSDRQICFASGMDRYITKPIDINLVIEAIEMAYKWKLSGEEGHANIE